MSKYMQVKERLYLNLLTKGLLARYAPHTASNQVLRLCSTHEDSQHMTIPLQYSSGANCTVLVVELRVISVGYT